MATAQPVAKKGGDALLKQAREDFEVALEYWGPNRKAWLEDAKFRIPGNQWPEKIRKDREAKGLPCLEADKLNQYVKQVVNDGRQNRPAVKVRPVDDFGDDKAADAFQGIIRDICDRSNADEAYDTALDHAATGGFGYFRVISQYVHEKTFLQELVVRRVRNPMAAMIGPHQLADGSDARTGFFIDEVLKTRFKDKYPNAKVVDWKHEGFSGEWSSEHTVRVLEYFYMVDVPTELHLLDDGTCATDEEYQLSVKELGDKVPKVVDTRTIPMCDVKWARLTGAEVLEENEWLGKYIPLIPVYGNETDLEGKVIYSGLIRGAKDPQRLHNYSRTKFAQRVALTPMAPWTVAEESIDGHEEWKTANTGEHQALVYRAFTEEGNAIPPPRRVDPTDIPAGFAQDAQMSEHDIQASMGMYNSSIGEKSNEKSGRAIMARQREGDTATFHYQDNLNRAIRYLGRILVDAIPKYYDSKRVVRILGEDGVATPAQLDPTLQKPSMEQGGKVIYNLNVGTYDVSVSAGPSYTTRRQEQADAMIELTRANPTMWQTHGDLIVKSQDWHNAEEFAKRSRLVLPPPIRQAIDAEESKAGQESPEVLAVKQQAQQMLDQAHQQIQAAEQGIAERDQALQQLQVKIQGIEDQQVGQSEKVAADSAKAQVEASARAAQAEERVRLEKQRADEADFALVRAQATRELEELQEQTIDAVKALLVPTPSVEQPAAAPPPGPSPELTAILARLESQTDAIMQGFAHLGRSRTATLSDGRQVRLD